MLRKLFLVLTLVSLPAVSLAGDLQRSIKREWLGAWLVVTAESYADCSGRYTNNRINGKFVKSAGAYRFGTGELAKLDRVDLKRSRLDLHLTLQEPILADYQDGPFTLYNVAQCQIELQIELPRPVVKGGGVREVEEYIWEIVERYATEDEARDSARFNDRERDEFPDDYEMTLARHAVWRAEQTNASVDAKLDHATYETTRLADRLADNPFYMTGFIEGVEAARTVRLDACPTLLGVDLGAIRRQAAQAKAREEGVRAEFIQGFEDGKVLIYGLEMMRNLPGCYVPVPQLDEAGSAIAVNH